MVKAYLRYESKDSWGVITSAGCNIAYDTTGKLLYAGCLENVGVWNVRQGALVRLPLLPLPHASYCVLSPPPLH